MHTTHCRAKNLITSAAGVGAAAIASALLFSGGTAHAAGLNVWWTSDPTLPTIGLQGNAQDQTGQDTHCRYHSHGTAGPFKGAYYDTEFDLPANGTWSWPIDFGGLPVVATGTTFYTYVECYNSGGVVVSQFDHTGPF